jgi:hypothetical protein
MPLFHPQLYAHNHACPTHLPLHEVWLVALSEAERRAEVAGQELLLLDR